MRSAEKAFSDRLGRAFEKLPVRADRRDRLPIMIHRLAHLARFSGIPDLPRLRPIGTKRARKELQKLVLISLHLYDHIYSMHKDALAAVDGDLLRLHPLQIAEHVFDLASTADAGWIGLQGQSVPAPKDLKRREKPRFVTRCAAQVYEEMTGLRVTVQSRGNGRERTGQKICGPFVEFLKAVFDALEVDASASSQAQAFVRANRAKTARM